MHGLSSRRTRTSTVRRTPRNEDFVVTNWPTGDLVFFHGLGNHILVVNTLQTIHQLFDKKAIIYSDRPSFTVVSELMQLGQVRLDTSISLRCL